jgi:predicted regulator of Ras-like GTPase activity (Roadblock/LC7/MglB family)
MPSIEELLRSFIRIRGVRVALVVGSGGLVLESARSPDGEPVDVEAVGAVAASGLVPALELGFQTGHGSLTQAIYEYRDAIIVIEALVDDSVLVIVTDLLANLGLLRLQARKARPDFEHALSG